MPTTATKSRSVEGRRERREGGGTRNRYKWARKHSSWHAWRRREVHCSVKQWQGVSPSRELAQVGVGKFVRNYRIFWLPSEISGHFIEHQAGAEWRQEHLLAAGESAHDGLCMQAMNALLYSLFLDGITVAALAAHGHVCQRRKRTPPSRIHLMYGLRREAIRPRTDQRDLRATRSPSAHSVGT